MSRSKAAKLLIDMGAPAGVYDIKGEVALSLLILKMPDVALIALDQFHSEDMINRKEYYFLNYLEGWKLPFKPNNLTSSCILSCNAWFILSGKNLEGKERG